MDIGQHLRACREAAGLNRMQASLRLDVMYTQLQRYEADRHAPGPAILTRMARAYACSVDALLGLVELPAKEGGGDAA